MGLIKNLFNKEIQDVTFEDIENLIKIKKEEDRMLEYKASDILEKPEQLSRYISAFLNSEGGIIVLGLREDDPKKKEKLEAKIYPQRIELVDEKFTKERINQLIFSNIQYSAIPAVNIYPIRKAGEKGAIFLIEALQGINPPYQAADGKYYRRLNATVYSMPHYEIADFFGRRSKPLLGINIEFLEVNFDTSLNAYVFTIRLCLSNVGKAGARDTYATFSFHNLEIMQQMYGLLQNIDNLRDGIPSLQFTQTQSVIHPVPGRLTRLVDLKLKVKLRHEPIRIKYDLVCEGMDYFQDEFSLPVANLGVYLDAKKAGGPIELHYQTPHLMSGLITAKEIK
ncbi:MAG: ATP-binding protein [Candidatus Omnitrophica bacterium]|nr:ATP-binding protein [Candidatus Omnitrophota bacterium]MDD5610949.1 ATP-binding protein [Candidatus Omnitrophota bacterium]